MKPVTILFTAFIGLTYAAPSSSRLAHRVANRQSHPLHVSASQPETSLELTNSTHVEYSSNWSGAIIVSPPTGETFNSVSAQFTVPTPSAPTSGSGSWSASAWVGIDGDTYQNAILQTGVDFTVTVKNGKSTYSYDAWYEWYPDYAYDFSGITVSAGDVIKVTVTATTTKSGTAILENVTTGKIVTESLKSSYALGGINAEWIVEDFDENDEEVAFADFGTITFTDCVATTAEESLGVTGATIIDIEQDTVLTSVSLASSSEVVVTYV